MFYRTMGVYMEYEVDYVNKISEDTKDELLRGERIYTELTFVEEHLGGIELDTVQRLLKEKYPEKFI